MSEFENNSLDEAAANQTEHSDGADEHPYVNTGSVAASVLGGLCGMVIALLICTVAYYVFAGTPYILFLLFPFCICFMSLLFNGSLNVGGIITETLFTFLGIFLFPAFCTACNQVSTAGISPFSVPLVALSEIRNSNFIINFSFSSLYIFPILVAIIGIAISWQIFRLKKSRLYD